MKGRRFARASKLLKALAFVMLAVGMTMMIVEAVPRREASAVYAASGRDVTLPEIALPDGAVSVNMADLDELMALPGVGETIGQAIIDERERHGPFWYPEDLLAVHGIGEKTVENLRDWLDMTIEDD